MGYETDVDVEVKRLQAQVARLSDEVDRWRQACRMETPDELIGALAEYARTLEETRDQAKTATREAEQLRVRLLPGDRDAVHALETLNRCRQDLDTAVRERDAAQNQCAQEQQVANEFALLLRDMRRMAPHEKDRVCLLSGDYALFHSTHLPRCAACVYDERIRTDAPPPVDWKEKYEDAIPIWKERLDFEKEKRAEDKASLARSEADCAALRAILARFERVRLMGSSVEVCLECMQDEGHGESCAWGHALHGAFPPGDALLERLRAAETEAVMGRQLATMLSVYAGEGGRNEGAVDVLGRKLAQLRAAVAVVEAARRLSEENENVISEHLPDTWEDADAMVDHALAAYDALGNPEVMCEHGEAFGCGVCGTVKP